ncbi:MAG: aldo/keto reductase [Vicinamibacterales bacterium]
MLTRRQWLGVTGGAAAALAVDSPVLRALTQSSSLVTKAIPSTGQRIPVVGLGSSATFSQTARAEDFDALREVFQTMVKMGGTVFDTAPGYGASEEVAGKIANELGIVDTLFWATKVNVAGRGGDAADPAAARAQIERSFSYVQKKQIDLIQVHNMGSPSVQLPILRELKAAGRIKYMGITTTFENQYADLIAVMKNEPLDFIGTDYAVDNRANEDAILSLAMERKIAVLCYAPFGRTRLFRRVGDRPVPDWAKEYGINSWAQFFLKFVVSHPAITAATPATSDAEHMADNMGGAMGRMPDEATRKRMAGFVDGLPTA